MTHASLFSGIGGFDLAAEWAGFDNIFQVEKDKFCQKVLSKNFPNTEKYKDIFDFNGKIYNGKIDVISGGFPCQPFSIAGKRKGSQDDRYLWDEMFRVITEVLPTWIIAENVGGLLTIEEGLVLEKCFTDLESANYQTQAFIVPAISKNAPHRRDRVWIVANRMHPNGGKHGGSIPKKEGNLWRDNKSSISAGLYKTLSNTENTNGIGGRGRGENSGQILECETTEIQVKGSNWENGNTTDTHSKRLQGGRSTDYSSKYHRGQSKGWEQNWYEVATEFCRVDDGIPNRVDRLKSLGNAIVPQVAYEIFMGIREISLTKLDNDEPF